MYEVIQGLRNRVRPFDRQLTGTYELSNIDNLSTAATHWPMISFYRLAKFAASFMVPTVEITERHVRNSTHLVRSKKDVLVV